MELNTKQDTYCFMGRDELGQLDDTRDKGLSWLKINPLNSNANG